MILRPTSLALAFSIASFGCGGSTASTIADVGDASTSDGETRDASTQDAPTGSDTSVGDGAAPDVADTSNVDASDGSASQPDAPSTSGCPATQPTNGSSCSTSGLDCTYGDDPRVTCRSDATCSGGSWAVAMPSCGTPIACPASAPTTGSTCAASGQACGYDSTTCLCYACEIPCSDPTTWHCAAPSAGCPTTPANLGTSCSTEGAACDYGSCTGGWEAVCTGGVWTRQATPCPG